VVPGFFLSGPGSLGLVCFAVGVWQLLPFWNPSLCLLAALAVWLVLSVAIWQTSKFRHGTGD
jgi:membrane protein implicated in regulation of membrane protease activity